MDGLKEVRNLDEFVDYVDVLHDRPFILKVVNCLSDYAQQAHLNAIAGEAKQSLHKLTGVQDIDIG